MNPSWAAGLARPPTSVAADLETELSGLRARMAGVILPFWSTEGFDVPNGLFRERLDFRARPVDDTPIRAMVQARQIYVYSHAALTGLMPAGAGLVERAADSLLRRFGQDGDARQGFAFSILRGAGVASPVRDSYTHAFILFALAWAYRLTADARLRVVIDQTLAFVDRHLVDPLHGGLHDCFPSPESVKAQNPLMHLLEATLALHEAFPDGAHLGRAKTIVELFERKLFRADRGALPEHFAGDWSAHPEAALGSFFEPGHHFEWAWLLRRYAVLAGIAESETGDRLWQTALASGLSPEGLVYDEVGLDLRPGQCRHRLWPHAEAMRAAAARFHSLGDPRAPAIAGGMLRALNSVFLGRPFAAGWVDRVGAAGEALVDGVPASSLYHLYGAWVEAERVFAPGMLPSGRAGP